MVQMRIKQIGEPRVVLLYLLGQITNKRRQGSFSCKRGYESSCMSKLMYPHKAWLFEHFLHPYPTDTDKHMLATQRSFAKAGGGLFLSNS
ncbi:BEL1-like homeodomain protein 5 [Arachis duranensis]|uniref:BEL1-like homeodomain protein 5 n=1 Tax=Arachis duranensis TaxID=130453 RepID=A0A9C6WP96_ARADU|nr:BEL1-like homeodomain protein 5 [Arachis duranensis]